VLGLIASDLETMRYVAGGGRPDEIADCAARWADSGPSFGDMALVIGCGGYDPRPLRHSGRRRTAPLRVAPRGRDRPPGRRRTGGNLDLRRAGSRHPDEAVDRTRRLIGNTRAADTPL